MTGWAFLVARGRRSGYRVLVAPDFLVAAGDHGVLEQVVAAPEGTSSVQLTSAAGRRLSIACATYRVTPAEVSDPRDEHGRPLRLIYGLVGTVPLDPAPEQLAAALAESVAAYQHFLAAEGDSPLVRSAARPVRAAAGQPAATPPEAPASPPVRVGSPPAVATPPGVPGKSGVRLGALAAAALLAAGVTVLVAARGSGEPQRPVLPVVCSALPTPTPSRTIPGRSKPPAAKKAARCR